MRVKVLEGRGEAGGRLRTVGSHFTFPSMAPKHLIGKGIPVDLGGSWIHGVAGAANPIYSFAKVANCGVVKSHWERAHLFTSDGKRAHRSILIWWMKLMSDVTQFFEDEIDDPNMSIVEALEEYMALNGLGTRDMSAKKMVGEDETGIEGENHSKGDAIDDQGVSTSIHDSDNSNGEKDVIVPKELQRTLTRIALVIAGEWEWAERMEVLSAKRSFEDGEQIGADVMIPDGYWTIFQKTILKEVEDEIEYNAEVIKIDQKFSPSSSSSSSKDSSLRSHPASSKSSSISPNSSSKVAVSTADGRIWTADRVICTLPLGVLKQNSVKFIPELSDHKVVSMARVGFGAMNKIYLQFDEPFWEHKSLWGGKSDLFDAAETGGTQYDHDTTSRRLFRSDDEVAQSKDQTINSHIPPHCIIWMNEKGDGRMTIGVNYNVVVPHSNILCIMVTGEGVPEVEDMKDEEIISEIMVKLRKCYEGHGERKEGRKKDQVQENPEMTSESAKMSIGAYDIASPSQKRRKNRIPDPRNYLITRWGKDKWTGGGSYASLVIGASHDDLKELSREEGKVFFAGEHTAFDGYLGSVHGAYHSGIRASHQILSDASIPLPSHPIHPSFHPEPHLLDE